MTALPRSDYPNRVMKERFENNKEIQMDQTSNYRTNSTQWQRCLIGLLGREDTDITIPGRTQNGKAAKRRSFLLATVATALALLPLSFYGLVGAQDDSLNAGSANEAAAEDLIQFNLVAAGDAVAACFPDATVKVKVLPAVDELGTDTLMLTGKRLPPNTTFAVFLTELPGAPFGATQFIARITTNAGGKASVDVRATIKDAFITQPINGQRVRTDLNHMVLWFANPGDAEDCFAPNPVGITGFDADGNAGPAAFSSRNALPGAPLP
jgi:hypothetical protein